jgi:tetratricopeptide (TPR) repeat protein
VEGDTEKAIATYKLWRQTYPRDYIPAVNLGNIYQNSGRLAEATQQLEESVQLFPSPIAYSNLAGSYSQLGQMDKMVETYKTWTAKFPSDGSPHYGASNFLAATGEYEKALEEVRRAVELEPIGLHYAALARAFLYLNKLDDAKVTAEKALADKHEHPDLHYYLYAIANYRGDQATLTREENWWKGQQYHWFFIAAQGGVAVTQGRMREAKAAYARSVETAAKAGAPDADRFKTTIGPLYCLVGDCRKGVAVVTEALRGDHSRGVLIDAAVTFAVAGSSENMESVLKEVDAKFPNEARLRKVAVPIIRALAALQQKQPAEALKSLAVDSPYKDLEFDYVRGLAQAQAQQYRQAMASFQNVIDHYGLAMVTVPMTWQMSYLQIARCYAATGDVANARRNYEKFLAFLKNPDPDLPVLKEARAELAKLPKAS